ncbi:RNA-guided endonuclease TnpB family protein [Pleurocapsa sp. CCALA 161]|uniref:RNA-guided endonuclease InsQ/TnpB family protein n=1 Tax=Pleurocapsa sp. CCALA 161 TaxID=2107688 RepID=UPI0018EBF996|nr:RNA-guided endonuclease TnpB family protein [Pleurocapsa sp. CCALA 161]
MLTRRITYRLYPSTSQLNKLFYWRRMHAYVYNGAVSNRITQYRKFGHSVDYFEQQASLPGFKKTWTEYLELNAGSLQATLKRVDFAFVRFFQGLAKHPKFRPIKQYSGWTYPDARQGFKVHSDGKNGYLELTDLGCKIQMRGEARTWGKSTTCTIVYRNGKWFASITVKCIPVRETGNGAIGLDFGCKTAIADSNGNKIEPPKFLKEAQSQINKISKQLRRKRNPEKRKVKGSRRWKKTQARLAKLKRKVANKRQNWIHHQAVDIVSCNSLIATEKLQIKNMTRKAKKGSKRKRQKAGLNRSMLDVGIGMLKSAIAYKALEANAIYLEAPTRSLKPTQRCNLCWKLTKKTLNDRLHVCSNHQCNHQEDRDVNSAQVCLTWARGLERASLDGDESSSTESPKVRYCGGFQQLAQTKRYLTHGSTK